MTGSAEIARAVSPDGRVVVLDAVAWLHVLDRHASYDEQGDVLYLRKGERREPPTTLATPEGHAVSFDEQGAVIAMTIVNARWLMEQDGKVAITVPLRVDGG